MQNFDHALLLQEGDPLMPAILGVYEKQGIKDGHSDKIQRGRAFKCDLGYRTGKPPGGYQGYFHLRKHGRPFLLPAKRQAQHKKPKVSIQCTESYCGKRGLLAPGFPAAGPSSPVAGIQFF
jgi:hypothetical protein